MFYFTVRQAEKFHQMSLEDLFSGRVFKPIENDDTDSITHEVTGIAPGKRLKAQREAADLIIKLENFAEKHENLYNADRDSLYNTFKIPKHHGGLRTINAPNEDLKDALEELVRIMKKDFTFSTDGDSGIRQYHTSAYAYIKGRSTVKCVEKHMKNESRWFARYDIHDFFGSTNIDFVMKMLSMIYPFNYIVEYRRGAEALRKALSLGFKDGGLPQGTPLSPYLINLMMIPFDFRVTCALRDFEVEKKGRTYKQNFVYTRYSDDMYVSCRMDFNPKQIENFICETLRDLDAPFTLNRDKTKYNSNQGTTPNWMLGVQLNAQNKVTVGSKRKKFAEAMVLSYAKDYKEGTLWELGDIRHMMGELSYISMVEKDNYKKMMEKVNRKAGFDVWNTANEEIKNRIG